MRVVGANNKRTSPSLLATGNTTWDRALRIDATKIKVLVAGIYFSKNYQTFFGNAQINVYRVAIFEFPCVPLMRNRKWIPLKTAMTTAYRLIQPQGHFPSTLASFLIEPDLVHIGKIPSPYHLPIIGCRRDSNSSSGSRSSASAHYNVMVVGELGLTLSSFFSSFSTS